MWNSNDVTNEFLQFSFLSFHPFPQCFSLFLSVQKIHYCFTNTLETFS